MKTILVATDFSLAATNAAMYAADMAMAIDADLYVLHVYQIPVIYFDIPIALAADNLQDNATISITKLKAALSLKTHGQLTIETTVKEGSFLEVLTTICTQIQPYAVVLGCQEKTTAERFMFGTQAVQVMRHLAWPVMAVPVNAAFSNIKKIGLACDFDDAPGTIPTEEIKAWVNDFNAALHVLNTDDSDSYKPEVLDQSAVLQKMLGKLVPVFHFIPGKNTGEGILHFAEANNIDLLIVIPRHRSWIDTLLHSSHTRQLVLHSRVPVMAFHPHFITSGETV